MELSWVEISSSALIHNLQVFRRLIGSDVKFGVAVKANAYGHGLVECSKVFAKHGAGYLCVNALFEAEEIRKADIKTPILLIGYTPLSDLGRTVDLNCELTAYNAETFEALGKLKKKAKVHLKIETGNHRQGVKPEDLPHIIRLIK